MNDVSSHQRSVGNWHHGGRAAGAVHLAAFVSAVLLLPLVPGCQQKVCDPGKVVECPCPGAMAAEGSVPILGEVRGSFSRTGTQACAEDGERWLECRCSWGDGDAAESIDDIPLPPLPAFDPQIEPAYEPEPAYRPPESTRTRRRSLGTGFEPTRSESKRTSRRRSFGVIGEGDQPPRRIGSTY